MRCDFLLTLWCQLAVRTLVYSVCLAAGGGAACRSGAHQQRKHRNGHDACRAGSPLLWLCRGYVMKSALDSTKVHGRSQVIRIKNTLKAVEIIELYLEMIKTRLDYLSKQKEIPAEMRTPMLSIAFASTRLTDIPELAGIRKNFESRFGRDKFTEVTKGDPGPASGVQENLLFCLSVLPPSVPAKVDAALEIMNELGKLEKDSEDLRADLERVRVSFRSANPLGTNTSWFYNILSTLSNEHAL